MKNNGWKIGTSNRNTDKVNYVPGPGKYNFTSYSSGPKLTIATKVAQFLKDEDIPGPGNYNHDDRAVSKVFSGFTMGSKY